MTVQPRHRILTAAAALALIIAGCAAIPGASGFKEGGQATVEGTITSIDTQPWSYDGNAVVLLETAGHGRVPVQLPARWGLCKAAPVDVESLAVGRRARAVGTVTAEGALLVCERAEHRLELTGT